MKTRLLVKTMKVKKETTLFTVLTGSHLYGTATDASDFDYKSVCLPALDDLLLNKKITNRKEKPEGLSPGDKMVARGVETEYLPLQVFFNDFLDGQTYALEVAFAVRQNLHSVPFEDAIIDHYDVSRMINELIDNFLTNNVQKMVGYAVSQSKAYGLKTQRYTSMSEVLRILNEWGREHVVDNQSRENLTFSATPDLVEKLLELPHVKMTEVMNAAGGNEPAPAIEICGKKHHLTSRIVTVVKSLEKSLGNYGERVKQFDGEGVDWKALSHAIRITEQVLELTTEGTLTFPRPSAETLATIKAGEMSLEEATEYLNRAFSKVDDAISTSVLRQRDEALENEFQNWKLKVLKELYDV